MLSSSTAGIVIRVIVTATACVAGEKPAATSEINGSAKIIIGISSAAANAVTAMAMLWKRSEAERSSSLTVVNTGTSTAETAPPIATSKIMVGSRVATSKASAVPVAPKSAAMTGSRTKPSRRLRMFPAATRAAAVATRRPTLELIGGLR